MRKYILLAVLLTGCVALTEEQKYERDARLAEYQDMFYATQEWCDNRGMMFIDWNCRISANGCPPKSIHDRFYCATIR